MSGNDVPTTEVCLRVLEYFEGVVKNPPGFLNTALNGGLDITSVLKLMKDVVRNRPDGRQSEDREPVGEDSMDAAHPISSVGVRKRTRTSLSPKESALESKVSVQNPHPQAIASLCMPAQQQIEEERESDDQEPNNQQPKDQKEKE